MHDLHQVIMRRHHAGSLWEGTKLCWGKDKKCQGRFAEYEIYYSFAECKYKERVVDLVIPFIGASQDCSREEMELCKTKGVLLKMCYPPPGGRGMCKNLKDDWKKVWRRR